jgi:hypothetical protein
MACPVGIVEFKAMAMAFLNAVLAVGQRSACARLQLARIKPNRIVPPISLMVF